MSNIPLTGHIIPIINYMPGKIVGTVVGKLAGGSTVFEIPDEVENSLDVAHRLAAAWNQMAEGREKGSKREPSLMIIGVARVSVNGFSERGCTLVGEARDFSTKPLLAVFNGSPNGTAYDLAAKIVAMWNDCQSNSQANPKLMVWGRFAPGDSAWTMLNDKAVEAQIDEIVTRGSGHETHTVCRMRWYGDVFERFPTGLFATKEELLQSL